MNTGELIVALGGVFALLSPIGYLVWRLADRFSGLKDALETQIIRVDRRIDEIAHQQALRNQSFEHLDDKVTLAVNGVRETAQHLRERTLSDTVNLNRRITDIERYLAKTTPFEARGEGRS